MSSFEEKVISLLEQINSKLDQLLNPSNSQNSKIDEIVNEGAVKPSAVVEKQEEEEKALEHPPVEGRRVCPDCGGTDFRTEEDKNQVLHQMGGIKIYAKKYICKRCGKEL
ncbi:MAG: hypothetical protein ACFFFB_10505 [Candidatus Heimdallarchaeota archaeon]